MREDQQNKRYLKTQIILLSVIFGLLFFCILRGCILTHGLYRYSTTDDYDRAITDLTEDWTLTYADGSQEIISLPAEIETSDTSISISHDMPGISQTGDAIYFDNNRHGVEVYADQERIYQVNTTPLISQLHYTQEQIVDLPSPENINTLKLTFTDSLHGIYYLPKLTMWSHYALTHSIIKGDSITLVILMILAVLAMIMIIMTAFVIARKSMDLRVLHLFFLTLVTMLWGYADSRLPVLFRIPQEVMGIAAYLSIMALPFFVANFVYSSLETKYGSLKLISALTALNMALETFLSLFGIVELQKTFMTAHVFTILTIIIGMACIYKSVREDKKSMEYRILYGSFIELAIGVSATLIFYWTRGALYYRNCFLFSILIFIGILVVSVAFHYMNRIRQGELKEAEAIFQHRLAEMDALSGLPNRRAFEEKLSEVDKGREEIPDAILFMLDVNGLKKVNDNYGHNAGDDLIVSASRAISEAFSPDGQCFRIGGDEFAVVLTDLATSIAVYEERLLDVTARINENAIYKLSIAMGFSNLLRADGTKQSISDWKQEADVNMYRNKIKMKSGYSTVPDMAKDYSDIIDCVITTLESKDSYTASHSDRVRQMSVFIAEKLGISSATAAAVEVAARLHDIGKVGIPDRILMKPGSLTDEEYRIIQGHARIGYDIISKAKGMKEIADIILHHHERWDGKGYPSGISAEEIPLESRIIAIADSIDAMTSKRVYREPMSIDECKEEIARYSGSMYDPAIASIVLENWSEITDIIMLHPRQFI